MEQLKCSQCKKTKDSVEFKKKKKSNGDFNKICIRCCEIKKKSQGKNKENYKCKHGKQKSYCKEGCGGVAFCKHGKRKDYCREGCGGSQICKHGKQKSQCKEGCGGNAFCKHGKYRTYCKECGGSQICQHGKQKTVCKECGGSQICEHQIRKDKCKICDPNGHLTSIVSNSVRSNLKSNKSAKSIEYLGCDIATYKEHIEKQFTEGMTWDNMGEWEIDHIKPMKYKENKDDIITLEENMKRLHFTNTQPLWKADNRTKGNRFIG